MSPNRQKVRQFSARAGVLAGVAVAVLVGMGGPATAVPDDPAVPFTPTLTRVPGGNCAAIIDAQTVPQPGSGQFGVRVKITQTGQLCGGYRVAVRWHNVDSGYSDGQSQHVDANGVIDAPDGIITGMGTAPGAGRVEAKIITTYEDGREMEYVAGTATFTLA
ncbi:hypothetical protein [Nocardia africana]|uniref:Uncharacterized protein n=1 Tax=Nocardia africana TaxID=134964 RepID=A0A378WVT4_9NOCA|nr:hypothetical protein [Nocardia africana]MCC3313760.1 hypothetical protein [Nocardia africana]SUA44857.1 Uncharacterised protein [Nocardia africana]